MAVVALVAWLDFPPLKMKHGRTIGIAAVYDTT